MSLIKAAMASSSVNTWGYWIHYSCQVISSWQGCSLKNLSFIRACPSRCHLLISISWCQTLKESMLGVCYTLHSLDLAWCKCRICARWLISLLGAKRSQRGKGAPFSSLNIVCCCPLLFSYEITLESKAIMRDYPFLPATSPCFDPFSLLQHQPRSLRPAAPHLWINWAQWMDRFYFH